MRKTPFAFAAFVAVAFSAGAARAQSPAPAAAAPQSDQAMQHVTMVPATIVTINYQHRMGATDIGFTGTSIAPDATGHAKVTGQEGRIQINAEFSRLDPASKFGDEYLTYVLWAVTPEGKTNNLGELIFSENETKLNVTTSLQTFGLIVTAEPYFAVSTPSNVVVLQNVVTPETTGTIEQAPVSYQLMASGAYSYGGSPNAANMAANPKAPLEYFEAENAVQLAINAGAQKYAPDALAKAQNSLTNAQDMETHHGDQKVIVQNSRDAVQNAADAHRITIAAEIAEEQAAEKAAAAQREAQAKAQADAAAAAQQQEAIAEQQAELQKAQAERDAAQAAAAQAQAQAAQASAEAQAEQQRLAAQQAKDAEAAAQAQAAQEAAQAQAAQQAAAQAEAEKQQLRATLLEQFNKILPTTDTPQGLKVNMADVLFAFGKYDLKPEAREALAKLSGIVLSHPGLKLAIDGYTDSVGTDALNQTLSEKRADAVRDYLVSQGIDTGDVSATGFGKANPVADNKTAAGRQQNRRVEIIISGEVIGTQIGDSNLPAEPGSFDEPPAGASVSGAAGAANSADGKGFEVPAPNPEPAPMPPIPPQR
jgi:outer membrane protein OmpA-like peptidoglycan-associated protein